MDVIPATPGGKQRKSQVRPATAPAAAGSVTPPVKMVELRPARALALPLLFIVGLVALSALPSIRANPRLAWSFWGAATVLLAWNAWLLVSSRAAARTLVLEIVLRKQHYVQACAQGSVLLYWGWYFREVYDSAALILAQLLFAYAFDILLAWSRRATYSLGFSPFPVIFSINLFLWFKPDWFYLQFVMIAVGFAAKELIRWTKDGRRVHIFNPSSFPLGLFSLGLLLTGNTAMTWGQEIATTFERPPYIRLWIFLIGLPGQYFFGVTLMTMSAVLTVVVFNLVYLLIFGTYFFVDAYVPAAVFLGMQLLFTDPSTSPRTELGRIIFGVMYGLGVVTLFSILEHLGAPTFYDKLMAVPVMNLCIQVIDRAAQSPVLRRLDPTVFVRTLAPRRRHLIYIGVWTLVFLLMSDPGYWLRPRRWVPFWQEACTEGRHNGCQTLGRIVTQYCRQGSGWACNELGILESEGRAQSAIPAQAAFQQACRVGFAPGCENASAGGRAGRAKLPAAAPAFVGLPGPPAGGNRSTTRQDSAGALCPGVQAGVEGCLRQGGGGAQRQGRRIARSRAQRRRPHTQACRRLSCSRAGRPGRHRAGGAGGLLLDERRDVAGVLLLLLDRLLFLRRVLRLLLAFLRGLVGHESLLSIAASLASRHYRPEYASNAVLRVTGRDQRGAGRSALRSSDTIVSVSK